MINSICPNSKTIFLYSILQVVSYCSSSKCQPIWTFHTDGNEDEKSPHTAFEDIERRHQFSNHSF